MLTRRAGLWDVPRACGWDTAPGVDVELWGALVPFMDYGSSHGSWILSWIMDPLMDHGSFHGSWILQCCCRNHGQEHGGQDGDRATRATQAQQCPAVVAAAFLNPLWHFKPIIPKNCWRTCQELCLCGRAPWGHSSRRSCGDFGDQGRERRRSLHCRSVSPWLCHPCSPSHSPAWSTEGIWLCWLPIPFSLWDV